MLCCPVARVDVSILPAGGVLLLLVVSLVFCLVVLVTRPLFCGLVTILYFDCFYLV